MQSTNGSGPAGSSVAATTAERKRQFALDRAARLKDPKVRHMGIDKAALDEQVREKEALRQLEKDRDAYYDRQALLIAQHASALQDEVDAIRTSREKDVVNYRQTYQAPSTRREWDLQDPQQRRRDLPARVSDDDPRNGPSSMQRFAGEDLDFTARRAAQQRQQLQWTQQQTDEKLAKKWMETAAERQFQDRLEETNYRTYEIEKSIADQRKEAARSTAGFNQALAEQKRLEQERDNEEETKLKLEEIEYTLRSDFMNERDPARGTVLGGSVKSERFKGISSEEKQNLWTQQAAQRDDMRRRRLMEVEEERRWAQQEQMQLRMADALERQRARERRQDLVQLSDTHKKDALNATERKKHNDTLMQNEVTEDYFKHWDLCL